MGLARNFSKCPEHILDSYTLEQLAMIHDHVKVCWWLWHKIS